MKIKRATTVGLSNLYITNSVEKLLHETSDGTERTKTFHYCHSSQKNSPGAPVRSIDSSYYRNMCSVTS